MIILPFLVKETIYHKKYVKDDCFEEEKMSLIFYLSNALNQSPTLNQLLCVI